MKMNSVAKAATSSRTHNATIALASSSVAAGRGLLLNAASTKLAATSRATSRKGPANPVNQKWYLDLLRQWETSGVGPRIFYFEAFDEAWKAQDDGWGLWDAARIPRYALCGTAVPSAPACNADIYSGAGYFH